MITTQHDQIPEEEGLQLPLKWGALEALPVLAANQILLQVDVAAGRPDMILLTFGHAGPPVVLGTPEEQREQLTAITEIVVQPIARLSLSRQRLRELHDLLQRTLDRWDEAAGDDA